LGVRIDPGSLGVAYFIPTVVVPPLLVTHGLMFWLRRDFLIFCVGNCCELLKLAEVAPAPRESING
jgi:hypothetical protein